MSRFSFLISSCDKFSDLWPNLEPLFNRYAYGNNETYLISDINCDPKFSFINFLSCNKEFSERIKFALLNITTEYVVFTLDDYFLDKNVKVDAIERIINFLEEHNGDYCRIYKKPKFGKVVNKELKIKKLSLNESCYEVNLYPGIWRRESLLKLISLCENENPWQFEVVLTTRCKKLGLNCYSCSDSDIFHFVDVIRKGKYLRHAYSYLKRNNLFISSRKKRTLFETAKLNMRVFIGKLVPMPLVRLYRKSKFNKSYSSYANKFTEK